LAKKGDIKNAVTNYQKAILLNPSLKIDPEKEAKKLASEAFLRKGEDIAISGDIKNAIASYQKALEFNPALGINPEKEAKKIAAEELVRRGKLLAQDEGKILEAIKAYDEAQSLDPNLKISALLV